MPKSKKESPWKNSYAKQLLIQDLRNGTINNMAVKEIYQSRPEYTETEWRLFSGRLKATKKQVSSSTERAKADLAAYANTMQRFPKNESGLTSSGTPRWDGLDAQRLLKQDIDIGKHTTMTANEMYNTRDEYKAFKRTVFSDHITQELKRRKFLATFKKRKEFNSKK